MTAARRIAEGEAYLADRTGCYPYRAVRYRAAAEALADHGLDGQHIVCDVGAGWTEFSYHLRRAWNWRGRYYPVDRVLDGTDLEAWVPPRMFDFFVCLETLEHLRRPTRLIEMMQANAARAIVVSVPNPRTTDVFGMDPDHKVEVTRRMLERFGFRVEERGFYGSPAADDSLFGVWTNPAPIEI